MRFKKIIYYLSPFFLLFLVYFFSDSINRFINFLSQLEDPSILISLIALLVSIIALVYTIRTYLLKEGEKFRFIYSQVSTIDCDDQFIESITLENLKDKSVVIFAIYFKIGNNNYIVLEEFGNNPLIIKPFEVYSKKYDPIICYNQSLTQTKIDHLLGDRSLKRSLVLSTTNGKIEVESYIDKWSTHADIFSNRLTNFSRPRRFVYKENAYGKNVKYLADLTFENGNNQVLKLRRDSYKYKKFEKLNLTKDCLKSKDKLKNHLSSEVDEELNIDTIKIIDWESKIEKRFDILKKEEVHKPQNYNKFMYYILGPIFSWYKSYKFRKNKKN